MLFRHCCTRRRGGGVTKKARACANSASPATRTRLQRSDSRRQQFFGARVQRDDTCDGRSGQIDRQDRHATIERGVENSAVLSKRDEYQRHEPTGCSLNSDSGVWMTSTDWLARTATAGKQVGARMSRVARVALRPNHGAVSCGGAGCGCETRGQADRRIAARLPNSRTRAACEGVRVAIGGVVTRGGGAATIGGHAGPARVVAARGAGHTDPVDVVVGGATTLPGSRSRHAGVGGTSV